ncbi:MAG: Unknown protein [uncultured Sulfurovum sp.]|uniref:SbsA Ig-like domain-containing protein n=1 Tax=uncultured Sulfurovum sp. TaxID=269237 RepID=A0A6S6TBH3_9BACT|nr:MAG: Unknown protein [uncultured Sulfurovum sp.]
MKKLFVLTIVLLLTTLSVAKEIDLEKSKGTNQEVISLLSPIPGSLTVDENVTFKVIFDIALDTKHVKKNDIKLTNISDTHKNIEGTVAYVANENAVTFKSNEPLVEGYYQIEFKSLKATKVNKDQGIKEIKYRFYVPEVINGHMLPPEPNEKKNGATLIGVDINSNGVRDDVERKIRQEYLKPLQSAILLQNAKFFQRTLAESTNNAIAIQADATSAINCEMYLSQFDSELGTINWMKNDKHIKDLTFNNLDRVDKYWKYNLALSGGVYGSGFADDTIDKCSEEVVNVLEGMK